jgi:hypothetical protein
VAHDAALSAGAEAALIPRPFGADFFINPARSIVTFQRSLRFFKAPIRDQLPVLWITLHNPNQEICKRICL